MIACNLNVFTPEERQRHQNVWHKLEASRLAVQELESGYAFQFPLEALLLVADYVDGERRCCPFFHFTIEVQPEALWLKLTGTPEVKAFLQSEMGR